jgi:hypothetical protein
LLAVQVAVAVVATPQKQVVLVIRQVHLLFKVMRVHLVTLRLVDKMVVMAAVAEVLPL